MTEVLSVTLEVPPCSISTRFDKEIPGKLQDLISVKVYMYEPLLELDQVVYAHGLSLKNNFVDIVHDDQGLAIVSCDHDFPDHWVAEVERNEGYPSDELPMLVVFTYTLQESPDEDAHGGVPG